jgi:hypothetical protein
MRSRCGPPKFDQQDWSQFDFSRLHMDGVTLDATSAAFVDLSERLFNSEEWRQHFQATVPALQGKVLGFYKEQSSQLQEEKAVVAEDFDQRIAAAQERSHEFKKSIETAAAPPVVQSSPESYHLAVKVTTEDVRPGLPGLTVQIMDPRNLAKELDKRDTGLEVLDPSGKPLAKVPGSVCIRLNQVETKVVTLSDSKKIASHKSAALGYQSEREARASDLAGRGDRLKQEREARLHDVDCRLEDTQTIIDALEKNSTAPGPQPAAPSSERATPRTARRSKVKPSKEAPPSPKKGRK